LHFKRGNIDTHNTHIRDRSISWFGTMYCILKEATLIHITHTYVTAQFLGLVQCIAF
jgi:hypothetical protein